MKLNASYSRVARERRWLRHRKFVLFCCWWKAGVLVAGLVALVPGTSQAEASEGMAKKGEPTRTGSRLTDLNLEQLVSTEVTSVSKRCAKLSDPPADASVITPEDIRRSGVAPGLELARVDAHNWATSPRGFNDAFASPLLVLMSSGRFVKELRSISN